jgi:hypothetical protein
MAVAQQEAPGPRLRRPAERGSARPFGLSRPDGFDLAVLLGFAALSAWILALYLVRVVGHHNPWTGTDGIFVGDQMMYVAWIRDASQHVLVSNLFVIHPTPHDYLQPAILISAGLVRLGVAPWVALIAWQPVAVASVFFAVRALVRRLFAGRVSRRVALVVALFGGSIGTYIFPDFWLGFWSWGYPFALLALASAIGSLLLYAAGQRTVLAAVLAGLTSWLHPWLGVVLLVILVSGEATMWLAHRRPPFLRLAATLVVAALPLAYYAALGRSDHWWRLGANASMAGFPIPLLAFMLAPLLAPALLAYRLRPSSFLQAAMRAWPPAAFVVFLLAEHGVGNSPTHGFLGITVPLAVLAVEGIASLPRPSFTSQRVVTVLAALATLAVCVPVTISSMKDSAVHVRDKMGVGSSEWRAFAYLAHAPQPGGVLTDRNVGRLLPGETGRHTYVGNPFWSQPDFPRRTQLVWELTDGQMGLRRARAFVRSTEARFLLLSCGSHRRRLARELGPMIVSQRRFGCASVYLLG